MKTKCRRNLAPKKQAIQHNSRLPNQLPIGLENSTSASKLDKNIYLDRITVLTNLHNLSFPKGNGFFRKLKFQIYFNLVRIEFYYSPFEVKQTVGHNKLWWSLNS